MNTEFEDMLPSWAIGATDGQLVLGAQLPTRDGRRIGNAHIIDIQPAAWDDSVLLYEILTDAGNRLPLTAGEVRELFHAPRWVSDVARVVHDFDRSRNSTEINSGAPHERVLCI